MCLSEVPYKMEFDLCMHKHMHKFHKQTHVAAIISSRKYVRE